MNGKRLITAAVTAIAALAIAVPAAVAGTGTAHRKAPACKVDGVPTPDTRHRIPAGISLYRWASHHAGGVANVLSATAECGPGWQQLAMLTYLDAGRDALGKPAPAGGLTVWTSYYKK